MSFSIPTCPPEQEQDAGAVLLHLGCALDHFKKCRCSSVPLLPTDAVTGLGCGRGTFIFEKLPGASNVQPGLSISEFQSAAWELGIYIRPLKLPEPWLVSSQLGPRGVNHRGDAEREKSAHMCALVDRFATPALSGQHPS